MLDFQTILLCFSMFVKVNSVPLKDAKNVIHVLEGETSNLKCALPNIENDVIVWKHNERVIFAGNLRVKHDLRINTREMHLTIQNTSIEDAGDYTCEIETHEGILQRYPQKLKVLIPARSKIKQAGQVVTVKSGTSLSLTCLGTGEPSPQVQWIKKGVVLSS